MALLTGEGSRQFILDMQGLFPFFRDYVSRCYAKCVTQIDKDRVGVILKGKLIRATSDGSLWTKDWAAEQLPL